MEALFHFIFHLFKATILAATYAFILFIILYIIAKFTNNASVKRVQTEKLNTILTFWVFIIIGLLSYSFTYWGNHGFGDDSRIPIGHGKLISNTNWTKYAYIEDQKTHAGKQIETTLFAVKDDKICGNLDSWFYMYQNTYFVLNLDTDELKEFATVAEFDRYATANNLPKSSELQTYVKNYNQHWSGFRLWLLP